VNLVGLEGYEGRSLREYRKNNGTDGVTPHIYGKDKHAHLEKWGMLPL
jgi:hypothetical protein